MIDHLSYSSISTYLLCPRSWKFHYVDKIETLTSPAQVFGSAFHNAIEAHLTTRAPIIDLWHAAWAEQVKKEWAIDWEAADTPEALYNDGVRMFSHPEVVDTLARIKPRAIETKVELYVPDVPVPIIGYVDLIEQDGVLADIKTSSKSWSEDRARTEMQPVFYLAARQQAGSLANLGLKFRHYVFVKTKTPKIQVFETTRSLADLFWLMDMIGDVWRGIEREVFPPNPGTWKCSPQWCGHWIRCRGRDE